MRKYILALALVLLGAVAHAQVSTADPVLMGFLTTSGCPGGQDVCFMPYSNANPLPVNCVR